MRIVTYKQGYARSASEAAFPNLWKGLRNAYSPHLGPTGLTLFDQRGVKEHGILTSMDANTDWVVDEKGYALDFGGSAYVELTSLPDVVVASKYSLSLWFKADVTNDNDRMFSFRSGSDASHIFFNDNVVGFNTFDGTFHEKHVAFSDTAEWHNIVGINHTGGTVTAYLDGVELTGTGTIAGSGDGSPKLGSEAGVGRHYFGKLGDFLVWNRILSSNEASQLHTIDPGGIFTLRRRTFFVTDQITAAITGTATATIDEADVVAGGKTIIITLTGDTWLAAGPSFNAERQAFIDGLDSAQVEATGWNAEVRDKEVPAAVVRTSDTVVTITLTASLDYDITATETITVTVPASALVTSASPVTGSPTFTVDQVAVGGKAQYMILSGELA